MEKSKKEKRNKLITLVLVVLFFVVAFAVNGQSYNVVYKSKNDLVETYVMANPIRFLSDKKEGCSISMYIDNSFNKDHVWQKTDSAWIVVVMPPEQNNFNKLRVVYDDGSFSELKHLKNKYYQSYSEYYISKRDIAKMKKDTVSGFVLISQNNHSTVTLNKTMTAYWPEFGTTKKVPHTMENIEKTEFIRFLESWYKE